MTSHYYSKPTRSRTQKLVLVLLVVIVLLIAALLFVWLKPGSSTTPGAANPSSGNAPVSSTTAAASNAPSTVISGTAPPATGALQWGMPVPGDGGPSTKSAAGVPRGYDASDAGATKAAINAAVAARWMKFRLDNASDALGELAVGDEAMRAKVVEQLSPVDSLINATTGKHDALTPPAGGKVLGAHLVSRDATTAKVAVLWENFAAPVKGSMAVTLEPIAVELRWESDDWLVAGFNTFSPLDKLAADPASAAKLAGPFGQVADWVPAPSEGWYW